VRYLGEIEATPAAVERLLGKLAHKYKTLHVCYEAGPTGYGLYRHIRALGYACDVIAPSLVPKRPGDRVKTNRRDAVTLARLLRAGELTAIWVPDEVHEAVRDLVRAREAAARDLRHKRQQVLSFLLRHGRIFTSHRHWSRAHLRWLAGQAFNHPAQQIVFQDQVDAAADAQARLERLDHQLAELVPTWSMAPVVAACQAMRGVSFLVAVTFVAEIGDVRRFESPRQLMAFLGLVPSERVPHRGPVPIPYSRFAGRSGQQLRLARPPARSPTRRRPSRGRSLRPRQAPSFRPRPAADSGRSTEPALSRQSLELPSASPLVGRGSFQ